MTIKVAIKSVYGIDKVYPLNHIEPLKTLTGTKTLCTRHLLALKELGFLFEVEGYTDDQELITILRS